MQTLLLPCLPVDEAPVLAARHRLLQDALQEQRGQAAVELLGPAGVQGSARPARMRSGRGRQRKKTCVAACDSAAPALLLVTSRTQQTGRPPPPHLQSEVKGGGGAARGVAPVHRALAVPVLVVGQHAVCGEGGECGKGIQEGKRQGEGAPWLTQARRLQER